MHTSDDENMLVYLLSGGAIARSLAIEAQRTVRNTPRNQHDVRVKVNPLNIHCQS